MANAIKSALVAERRRLERELKKVNRSLVGLFGERKRRRKQVKKQVKKQAVQTAKKSASVPKPKSKPSAAAQDATLEAKKQRAAELKRDRLAAEAAAE